jgi:uncharacterized protein (DUF697 family)
MKSLEPLIFIFGGIIVATVSAAITAAYYRHRMTGLYNRGWTAGKTFAREFPDN